MKSFIKKNIEIKWKLIGLLGKLFIDFLFFTTKIESVGFEKVKDIVFSRKAIGAVWHSRILLITYIYRGWNIAALVSQSEDGEIIARILQKQGYETIRGSTTRGGLKAIVTLIKHLKEKAKPAVIIPDGPQGPRFKVQPGIISLAKKTGYSIIPITYSAKKMKIFASWDKFILPFPFTTCRIIYGNPVYIPENADKNTEEKCRTELEKELCDITKQADSYFGHEIT